MEKLLNNVPIQYLTNKQEFYGIEFYVDENVLIPQPDTEILVEEVIQIAKKENKKKILDLCTGSGAIAIALEKNIENANIMATDISEKALEVAKKNDKEQKIKFIKSDMFENLQNETFDIIVSNPPYIKEHFIKELPKEVQKEPIIALNGGVDGLEHYKIIINNAKKYLKNNGYLCLEIGEDQKEEVLQLLEKHNYTGIYSKTDLAGNDRIIIAKVFTIKNF